MFSHVFHGEIAIFLQKKANVNGTQTKSGSSAEAMAVIERGSVIGTFAPFPTKKRWETYCKPGISR